MLIFIIILICTIIFIYYLPFTIKAKNKLKNYKILKSRRLKSTAFPKPFPNTWYYVCKSSEINKNNVQSFSAFGEDMVIFRDNNNDIGILHAYCPHLGTHLGQGGKVVNNCIVCPYHEWAFNTDGICKNIPYCNKKITERCNTKKYYIFETKGMIFVWYNSSGNKPIYNIKILTAITSDFTYICSKNYPDYHMHIMEPSHNSADWYHFKTVHKYLPLPFIGKYFSVDHAIKANYTDIQVNNNNINDQFYGAIIIEERVIDLKLFNFITIPKFFYTIFNTTVIIETPSLILFSINIPLIGKYRAIMTLTPIEPYRHKVTLNVWCKGFLKLFARIFTYLVMSTVEQDREVWENKMYINPRNLVAGDGPFASYSKWLNKFYDSNSKSVEDTNIEW